MGINGAVALGGAVWEGRSVERVASRVAWAFLTCSGVQVGGRLLKVAVLVGMSTVGIMVGGGKGLKAIWGLIKICAKTINRPSIARSTRPVMISHKVIFFKIKISFLSIKIIFICKSRYKLYLPWMRTR